MASRKPSSDAKRGSRKAPSSRSTEPQKRVGGIKPRAPTTSPSTPIPEPQVGWGRTPKVDYTRLGDKDRPASNTADNLRDVEYGSYYLARIICCERYDEGDAQHQRVKGKAFEVPCRGCIGEAEQAAHFILKRMHDEHRRKTQDRAIPGGRGK